MRALLFLLLLSTVSCGKPGKPASAYCRPREFMIIQCKAEAALDFPDPSLRDYQDLVCSKIYPVGQECWQERDNYFY